MIARLFFQFKYLICFSGLPDQRRCWTVGSQLSLVFFQQNIKNIVKTTSIELNTELPEFCLHFAVKFKSETA